MATLLSERGAQASWRDYLELTKPKVVLLMLITSLVGMFLATRAGVPWTVLVFGNLGIGLCAGAAAAVNHVVDRRIDSIMARTHKRPVTAGRVSPAAALTFALLLAIAGMSLLLLFTNELAAWLTLASLLGYAVIYTGFLKRATPQNIVIGGLAGAAPPLLGWVAVTGQVTAEPLLLVLIIFAWTPPHFWALALYRVEDYRKSGLPMLPVTHGNDPESLRAVADALQHLGDRVVTVDGDTSFAEAVRRKLLLEIAGAPQPAAIDLANAAGMASASAPASISRPTSTALTDLVIDQPSSGIFSENPSA